jgi:3-oxoacyl-ACP reductase-like protein
LSLQSRNDKLNIASVFTRTHRQSTNALTRENDMNQSAPTARLRLQNQVAVVAGGSRGIGEGIVRRFAEEGAKVVFSDLLTEKGKALEEELGERVAFFRADATSQD